MDNARLDLVGAAVPQLLDENFAVVDDLPASPALPPFADVERHGRARAILICVAAQAALSGGQPGRQMRASGCFHPSRSMATYGIEANEFALHSRIAAQPELGVLPKSRLLRDRESVRAGLGLGQAAEQAASERDARAQARRWRFQPDAAAAGEQLCTRCTTNRSSRGPRWTALATHRGARRRKPAPH